MAKARRNKLTLKKKSHSQSTTISRLDKEYNDQRDLSSTPKPFLDALEWIGSIPELCCEHGE